MLCRIFANAMVPLTATSRVLFSQPAASPAYAMRLYPITLERAAMLDALDVAEQYALDTLRATWDEEQQKVEEEWRQGKIKVKERCLEAIEERRKRAREEKDGEGLVGAGTSSPLFPKAIYQPLRLRRRGGFFGFAFKTD